MNKLAEVVHNIVTGEGVPYADTLRILSPLQQAALADLQFLLHKPPQDLAAFAAETDWPEEWLILPLLVERPKP